MHISSSYANKFRFEFSNNKYILLNDAIIKSSMPGFSMGDINLNKSGKTIKLPGSSFTIDDLTITFKSDGKYKYWIKIFKWLINNFNGNNEFSAGSLFLLDASDNPIFAINLYNMFPVNLTEVAYDRTDDVPDIITFDATFKVNGVDYTETF